MGKSKGSDDDHKRELLPAVVEYLEKQGLNKSAEALKVRKREGLTW